MDRHTVRVRARLELVRHPELQRTLPPGVRIVRLGDRLGRLPDEHLALEVQEVRLLVPLVLPPGVEVGSGDDVFRDPLVVEVEQRLVVDDDVPAPGPVLQLLDLAEEFAVVGEELVVRAPVALDQGVADEQLPADLRVDPAVVHLALGDDRDAVQCDLLVRHHRRLVLLPVRFAVRPLEQVLGERLDPLRLDPRVDAGPEAGGLDELGGHHETRGLLEEGRAREDRELGAAGAQVLVLRAVLHVLHADVGQEAGEEGVVDAVAGGVLLVEVDAHLLGDRAQLGVDVLPFADAQEVQVLLLAHPPEGARSPLLLLLADVAPEVEIREEVARLVLEAGVLLVGLGLLVGRALARILDGERGRYDHDLADTAVLVGLQDHPGQARVDGQLGQFAARLGEPLARVLLRRVESVELLEQLDAVADVAVVRRVDERELLDVAEAGRGHLEDDGGEVGTEDLRVRELRAGDEVVLRVEADADSCGGCTG